MAQLTNKNPQKKRHIERNAKTRMHFIDFARTYAVGLALLSHAFMTYGIFDHLGDKALYVKFFTRMATPMFIFMFGFMLEFVYVRRFERDGIESVRRRLLVRSFQCYIAYAFTSLSGLLGGYGSIEKFFLSLFFFEDSRLGNILRFYSVAMVFAIPVIQLRLKYGRYILWSMLFCVYCSMLFLMPLKNISLGAVDHLANVLIGLGQSTGGPSIWHGMAFMLSGMIVAESLRKSKHGDYLKFYISCVSLVLVCIFTYALVIDESLLQSMVLFANYHYRKLNHIGYYLIGSICSICVLMLFCRCVPTTVNTQTWLRYPLSLGYSSLLSYSFGNIILNLSGLRLGHFAYGISVLSVIVFFIALTLIVKNIAAIPYYSKIKDFLYFQYGRKVRTSQPPTSATGSQPTTE